MCNMRRFQCRHLHFAGAPTGMCNMRSFQFRLLHCAGAPRGTCNMRIFRCRLLRCAGVSKETCNTRIFLCRFLHCADVPSGMSSMPTVQWHLGCAPGPSRAVDQVRVHKSFTRTPCVVQSEMFNLRTPHWRLLLCAPSPSCLPFRRHSYLRCLRLLKRRSLNRFRRQLRPWRAEYPMFQTGPRLTHRMYLSMNSRYTNFCCASSSQGNRSAHVLIASRN
mmetsp:Transcript_26962/g.70901  ORF Transcript_26962/g.70901 Transcript_26962/m.70901 type:complete len:219 (-) Transcript_26962:992-1648(-)